MDIKQMTYILTIAEEGGITKAAGKLFITQSALDQQLLKLENELGTQLFYRARNNFSLTAAGKVYVEYAKKMVSLKHEAYRIIHDLADRQKGTLTLAFAPERGMEMFLGVYPSFYEAFPEINVIPREIGVRRQLEMLQNDELDLGFVSMQEQDTPGLICTPLFQEEFVLIAPLSHPLSALAAPAGAPLAVVEPAQLHELTYGLMYRESTQRGVIDPLFDKNGVKAKIFLETASNRANVSMVEKGLCCSIVPYFYVKDSRDVHRFRISTRPKWNVSVCYRRSRYLSRAAQHFIQLAGDYFQREMAQPI